jgi:hypothetical protein
MVYSPLIVHLSVFVVIFFRDEKQQLLLGIRRANRQPTNISSSVLSSDSMHIGILAAAAHAAANNSPFTIFYNPRSDLNFDLMSNSYCTWAYSQWMLLQNLTSKLGFFRASPTEFVVPFAKYQKALYGNQISLGMRFRMMFETEELGTRRYTVAQFSSFPASSFLAIHFFSNFSLWFGGLTRDQI